MTMLSLCIPAQVTHGSRSITNLKLPNKSASGVCRKSFFCSKIVSQNQIGQIGRSGQRRIASISFQLATIVCLQSAWQACIAADLPENYVPGPVEVGPEIWAGVGAACIPFVIGSWEFGKRIIIQQRCARCQGSGLVWKGQFARKCPECGGFFPWQGWKKFFTSTAAPGNGGPLRAPRGQTSILYKIPPKIKDDQAGISRSEGSSVSGEAVKALQEDFREGEHMFLAARLIGDIIGFFLILNSLKQIVLTGLKHMYGSMLAKSGRRVTNPATKV